MEHLADGYDLSIDIVLFEILIEAQVDLDFLNSVHPRVQVVLNLVHFTEASFSDDFDLFESATVPILLKVVLILVVMRFHNVPEDEALMLVRPRWFVHRRLHVGDQYAIGAGVPLDLFLVLA